jgi:D-lactate dehydrogenase (cytochrome)
MPSDFAVVTPAVCDELAAILGVHAVSADAAQRDLRSHDVSGHPAHAADVIAWPQTAEQVAQVLRFASDRRIAVTPWGPGTSVEGNPIPVHGGILLSLERMNRIVAIHSDDMQATVEAGVKYRDLNRQLEPLGLFFPVDPGGDATLGGMLANNAAGPKALKYGATKDNALAIEVALCDGRMIRCGSRSIKQSSGYDLLHWAARPPASTASAWERSNSCATSMDMPST